MIIKSQGIFSGGFEGALFKAGTEAAKGRARAALCFGSLEMWQEGREPWRQDQGLSRVELPRPTAPLAAGLVGPFEFKRHRPVGDEGGGKGRRAPWRESTSIYILKNL